VTPADRERFEHDPPKPQVLRSARLHLCRRDNGPTGNSARAVSQGAQLLPAPLVDADLAATAALAAAHQDRAAALVEVVPGERQRLLDTQPRAPPHDYHRSQPPAMAIVPGVAHHRHDLIDRGSAG
jgi:hypothetical protein